MTGVTRGMRVVYSRWGADRQHSAPAGEPRHGLVLDRAAGRGTWWVSVPGGGSAVIVRSADLEPAATR